MDWKPGLQRGVQGKMKVKEERPCFGEKRSWRKALREFKRSSLKLKERSKIDFGFLVQNFSLRPLLERKP